MLRPRVTDTGWPAGLTGADLRPVLSDIAHDWQSSIRARTAAGVGADGRQFARRQDGSRSTLRDSGRMMQALDTLDVDDRRFVLGLRDRDSRRKAYFAQDGARGRRRPFLGVDDHQIEQARQQVADARTGKR